VRIQDSGSGRQQGSPNPRDYYPFLKALAARNGQVMSHLNREIATNQVKLGDLDERVQQPVHNIQDTREEVEDGKELDAERRIAFEEIIIVVDNAT